MNQTKLLVILILYYYIIDASIDETLRQMKVCSIESLWYVITIV
jgi:hypothetical protein